MSDPRPLTAAEARTIAELADPVERNRRITDGYHALATALDRVVGPGTGANWCAFGVWASRQAGSTIRKEDLRRTVERRLGNSPAVGPALDAAVLAADRLGAEGTVAELRASLGKVVDLKGAVDRAADGVARGNALVFGEIGVLMARFLEVAGDEPSGVEPRGMASLGAAPVGTEPSGTANSRLAEFLNGLPDGEPPAGMGYLRRAVTRYHALATGTVSGSRPQTLLLANLEIAVHEQMHVHAEISAAMNAAIPDAGAVRERVLALLFRNQGALLRLRTGFWRLLGRTGPLDRAIDILVEELRTELRRIIAAELMVLELPGGTVVPLGRDLTGAFPASLARLDDPELVALLARIDPTQDSLLGTGARDWAELSNRLHFIADLFRLNQENLRLFDSPSAAESALGLRDVSPAGAAPTWFAVSSV